ncbi:MAG: hypothetical protein ACLPSH_20700 [Vulcanimicrobiaceae bacterium]
MIVNQTRILALLALAGISACSGGSPSSTAGGLPNVGTPGSGASSPASASTTARFTITVPAASASATASTRKPAYVSTATQSVVITLTSVNGTAYTGSSATIASNLTTSNPNCSGSPLTCTVAAPAVPGSDTFLVSTYDALQTSTAPSSPAGNLLSTATLSVTVSANIANTVTTPLVLSGVPASIALSSLPAATAGTSLAATAFIVAVRDAGGNTIVGPYTNPVTLSDSDTSGASTIATSGSDSPSPGQLLSSSDVAKIAYSGLAIPPATIAAASSGATGASATFAPTLNPIGPSTLGGGVPVNELGATTPATFTASEVGWSDHGQSFAASLSGCSSLATVSPASGTTFTAALVANPTAGSCSLTLRDGVGQSLAIPLGYATPFAYTGASQPFTVPSGLTQVFIAAAGAQGGAGGDSGGTGGFITALEPATGGSTLTIQVGGAGTAGTTTAGAGGYHGGGNGGGGSSGGGGGATAVIDVSTTTTLLVAGGGGGGGADSGNGGGGDGGSSLANPGGPPASGGLNGLGGGGGSTAAGGAAGVSGSGSNPVPASPGVLGSGGAGGLGQDGYAGGGGGGGYYGGGGGGGGGCCGTSGGGGGGPSFSTVTASSNAIGGQTGNGSVTITW